MWQRMYKPLNGSIFFTFLAQFDNYWCIGRGDKADEDLFDSAANQEIGVKQWVQEPIRGWAPVELIIQTVAFSNSVVLLSELNTSFSRIICIPPENSEKKYVLATLGLWVSLLSATGRLPGIPSINLIFFKVPHRFWYLTYFCWREFQLESLPRKLNAGGNLLASLTTDAICEESVFPPFFGRCRIARLHGFPFKRCSHPIKTKITSLLSLIYCSRH